MDFLPKKKQQVDLSKLKEDTLYEVRVAWNKNNPIHTAFLFVGFHTGAYCEVYTNSYDGPVDVNKAYWIEIVRELAPLKSLD